MAMTANALRELHRIHRQLTDLRDRLDRGPKQVQAAETNLRKLEADLQQTRDATQKLRMQADEKQLQLKEREDRIEVLQGKLNGCSSNREYQALKDQIGADLQANSVLADEILEALERIDEMAARFKQAETRLARAKQESEKVHRRVAGEQETLHSELARVRAELKQAEAGLPSVVRQDYARIVKARGEAALAPVDGECCGGCYQTLSSQTMNELYLSKLVFCKSCGCLLYLPEDRAPGDG